jgi:hypothetical protein
MRFYDFSESSQSGTHLRKVVCYVNRERLQRHFRLHVLPMANRSQKSYIVAGKDVDCEKRFGRNSAITDYY